MKLYDITGIIKCGHRLFTLRKYVVAESKDQALALYLTEHPHARHISIKYKYELKVERTPHIVFTNAEKKS